MSQNQASIHVRALEILYETSERQIEDILNNYEALELPDNDDELGCIYDAFKKEHPRIFVNTTNFTEQELIDIYLNIESLVTSGRQRGPKSKVTLFDSILVILAFYKFGGDCFCCSDQAINIEKCSGTYSSFFTSGSSKSLVF